MLLWLLWLMCRWMRHRRHLSRSSASDSCGGSYGRLRRLRLLRLHHSIRDWHVRLAAHPLLLSSAGTSSGEADLARFPPRSISLGLGKDARGKRDGGEGEDSSKGEDGVRGCDHTLYTEDAWEFET